MCNVLHLIATDTTLIKSNDAGKSKLVILANFRDRRLPSRLHLGPLQPQEEQAAAHRQPEQEDDHLSGMVSSEISTFIFVWRPRTTRYFASQRIHFPNNKQV